MNPKEHIIWRLEHCFKLLAVILNCIIKKVQPTIQKDVLLRDILYSMSRLNDRLQREETFRHFDFHTKALNSIRLNILLAVCIFWIKKTHEKVERDHSCFTFCNLKEVFTLFLLRVSLLMMIVKRFNMDYIDVEINFPPFHLQPLNTEINLYAQKTA